MCYVDLQTVERVSTLKHTKPETKLAAKFAPTGRTSIPQHHGALRESPSTILNPRKRSLRR